MRKLVKNSIFSSMFHMNKYLCNYSIFHHVMKILKKIFKYLEPAWTGQDRKISLRSSLAIAFSIDFIRNINFAITKWDVGRSLEGLSLILGIEAGLIVGLLGLTTYQNMSNFNRTETYLSDTGEKVYPGSQKAEEGAVSAVTEK